MIYNNKCAICGGTHILTVHHINLWKNDLQLGNLILLCTNCHLNPELSLHKNSYSMFPMLEIYPDSGRVRKWGHNIHSIPTRDFFRMYRNWEYEGLLPPHWPPPYSSEDTEFRINELNSVFLLYALLYDINLELYGERFLFDGDNALNRKWIVFFQSFAV